MKKRIFKISALAIAIIILGSIGFRYIQSNAIENKDSQQKVEQETGISPTNETVLEEDDVKVEMKEYHIQDEEEKENVKSYMKNAVSNGEAFLGE